MMLYVISVTTKKISIEYTQKEVRRKSKCISTNGASNGGNEGKEAVKINSRKSIAKLPKCIIPC